MRAAMVRLACAQVKISDSVVDLVEVDVVNPLMIGHIASKMFGHDGAMFGEPASGAGYDSTNGVTACRGRVSSLSLIPLVEAESLCPRADAGGIAAKLSRQVAR